MWYIQGMDEKCRSSVRRLAAWEIQEARRVFDQQIRYDDVRIHECVSWPDRLNAVGARLKGQPPPLGHNAVTLGNRCFFPIRMAETPLRFDHPEHYKIGWLIHELTHVWQYQRMGWRYLVLALRAQFREGAQAYNFGGENGLIERLAQGWKFTDFNLEQQGDITRSYYERLCRSQEARAWSPFIAQLQNRDHPIDVA